MKVEPPAEIQESAVASSAPLSVDKRETTEPLPPPPTLPRPPPMQSLMKPPPVIQPPPMLMPQSESSPAAMFMPAQVSNFRYFISTHTHLFQDAPPLCEQRQGLSRDHPARVDGATLHKLRVSRLAAYASRTACFQASRGVRVSLGGYASSRASTHFQVRVYWDNTSAATSHGS